ncbi:MAG: hypothetical protein JW809_14755 [Pirellulales bacterium]|nr:hypothetical protein [Pirellulales bacterium]
MANFSAETATNGRRRVFADGGVLVARSDLVDHRPAPFDWGPAASRDSLHRLALAILARELGEDSLAVLHYRDFAADVLAPADCGAWFLSGCAVRQWLDARVEGYRDRKCVAVTPVGGLAPPPRGVTLDQNHPNQKGGDRVKAL